MESFFVRYRNLVVLLAILLAQIIGLAVQVQPMAIGRITLDPRDGPGVRLIRLWANALVSPPERAIHRSKLGVVEHLAELHRPAPCAASRTRNCRRPSTGFGWSRPHCSKSAPGSAPQALIGFQEKYIYKTIAAQASASSGSDQSRVFYIDKGSDDGLDRDMAVITAGRHRRARCAKSFRHSAQVLAINDQTSGAGVILETTRIRGILRGNAAGQPQIVGILADSRIQPGEKVLTAGGDQIFPRGLPVGVVEKVDPRSGAGWIHQHHRQAGRPP